MKFILEIDLNSDAFLDKAELPRVLARASNELLHEGTHMYCAGHKHEVTDFNGNTVGHYVFQEQP
jgi:hypothetical protein